MALPKNGFNGVERAALIAACRNNIAECGTLNGCANAWNAEPHVICHGAMYVTTNCS